MNATKYLLVFCKIILITNVVSGDELKLSDNDYKKQIGEIIGTSSNFKETDFFGVAKINRIVLSDGIAYFTGDDPENKIEIVLGKPDFNSILNAETPEEFISALDEGSRNNLAAGWNINKKQTLAILKASPNHQHGFFIKRIYLTENDLWFVDIESYIRYNKLDEEYPPCIVIGPSKIIRLESNYFNRVGLIN